MPAQWDFTLATLEGDRFITASQLPGRVLVNFWGVNCPPCLAELPLLQQLHQRAQGPQDWQVLLIATDAPKPAWRMLQRLDITLPTLRGGGQGSAGAGAGAALPLMRTAGNSTGALPFTVLLREGQICATHSGALDAASLDALLQNCPANQS